MVDKAARRRMYDELLSKGYSPSVALRKTEMEYGEPGQEKKQPSESIATKMFGYPVKSPPKPTQKGTSSTRSFFKGVSGAIGSAGRFIKSPEFQTVAHAGARFSSPEFLFGDSRRPRKQKHRKKSKTKQGKKRRRVKALIYLD